MEHVHTSSTWERADRCSVHKLVPVQAGVWCCRVAGPPLFPAAAFFELGVAAGRSLADDTLHPTLGLHAVAILAPCMLPGSGQAVPTLLCQLAGSSLEVISCRDSSAPAKHLTASTASTQPLFLQKQQPGSWLPAVLHAARTDLRPAAGRSSIARLAAVQAPTAVGGLDFAAHPAQGDCVLHLGAVPQHLQVG